ncbi:DUF4760 domain-containing protein [Brevundimonas intermedia]|uniref:DUF4760 domain-containing protein n=1 Tax=Brevundimonas intermedia TaxID=74315 RepID=UPI00320A34A3
MVVHSWAQRREIIAAILASSASQPLAYYQLSAEEEAGYRRLAEHAVRATIRKNSSSKGYRSLRTAHPFNPVWFTVAIINVVCLVTAAMLVSYSDLTDHQTYPLIAGASTIVAVGIASLGWGVAGWVAQRNARVQHTINLISTRFSQPAFVKHISIFNDAFGDHKRTLVTTSIVERLSVSRNDDDRELLQSIKYILNYFEFISSGIIRGDLDFDIVRSNLRSNMIFYYEKCLPFILDSAATNPTLMEHYSRVRAALMDP